MCLAFLLCFPTAILAYVLDVPAFAAGWLPDKRSRRVLHGACNLLGTLFTVVGFVIAFTYHGTMSQFAAVGLPAGHFGLE